MNDDGRPVEAARGWLGMVELLVAYLLVAFFLGALAHVAWHLFSWGWSLT